MSKALIAWAVVLSCGLVLVACSRDNLQPFELDERPDGTFELMVECADSVTARVLESANEIRIDRILGDRIDGDCLGGVSLELAEPPGSRRILVQHQAKSSTVPATFSTWIQIDAECDLDVYAHEHVEEEWGWTVPRPC